MPILRGGFRITMHDPDDLSHREREILRLVATGASNKEIARQLSISVNTVKVHLRNIFAKAGVASRTEATLFAIREGLVPDVSEAMAAQATSGAGAKDRGPIAWRQSLGFRLGLASLLFVTLAYLAARTWQASQVPATPDTLVALEQSRWQAKAPMPTARSGLAVAAYENRIYAIGGETVGGVTEAVESYDVGTDSWSTLPSKPTAVADVQAAILGGMIYVPGGRLPSGELTDVLEVYDPRRSTWNRLASLPIAISGYALAAFEGKLYLFGGWDGQGALASVYGYDPQADSWRSLAPMPTARSHAGATTAAGAVYVLAGYDGIQALAVNEAYFPARDTGEDSPWEVKSSLPDGRYGMGVASITDIVYVIGGLGEESDLPWLEYLPGPDQWQSLNKPFSGSRSGLGVVASGSYLFAIGGRLDDAASNENLAYKAVFTILLPPIP